MNGRDVKSIEHTAPTDDEAPQPQQLTEAQYKLWKWDLKQKGAREDAKALYINIMEDCSNLNQEVVCHVPYLTAEDHVIADGMRKRKPWKEQMSTISKDLVHLKYLINTFNIARTDVDVDTLVARVNHLQNLTPSAIRNVEAADLNQGILSKKIPQICPQEIPKYAGTPSENSWTSKKNSTRQ